MLAQYILAFGSALQAPGVIQLDDLSSAGRGVRVVGAHRIENLDVVDGPAGDIDGDGFGEVLVGGRSLINTDTTEYFIFSGKMLAQEKTLDGLVEVGVLFPELVEP